MGSYDESASVQYTAGLREHHFKKEPTNSLDIFKNKTAGCIQGESSAFFDFLGNHLHQPGAAWRVSNFFIYRNRLKTLEKGSARS